jgi:hypothetical protein
MVTAGVWENTESAGDGLASWETLGVRFVKEVKAAYDLMFSVCTLVLRDDRYRKMVGSFTAKGFNASNSEFIALDNRGENRFDGFSWLRRVLPDARGRYILFCHDDVELVSDDYDDLIRVLGSLEAQDPGWTVAGNAGHVAGGVRSWRSSRVRYLISPGNRVKRHGLIPSEVESLDDNFFVINRSNLVLGSLSLKGFHFYASDLVLNSERSGGRAYVIPFEVLHDSNGTLSPAYYELRKLFRKEHGVYHPLRVYITTTGVQWFGAAGLLVNAKRLILGVPDRRRVKSELDYRPGSLWARVKRKANRIIRRRTS